MDLITKYFAGIKKFFFAHKIWSALIIIVVLGGGWFVYSKATSTTGETRYVMGAVTRGTIVASVSASGQVAATNQVDVKPKVTGNITWVGVKAGDTVRAGQALATIDSTDAKQAYADAQKSLNAAELQYQKDTAQAPIDHQNSVNTLDTANQDLQNDYNDTFNNLSNTYLDLPTVMTGVLDVLYGYDLDTSKSQWNMDVLSNFFSSKQDTAAMLGFRDRAKSDYATAQSSYNTAVLAYKNLSRNSSSTDLEALLDQSITMTTSVAQALQSELNFLGSISDLAQEYNMKLPSGFTTLQTNARGYLSTVNGDLSTLLAQKKTITSAKQAITTAQQNITLSEVGNDTTGANPISLQIEKNNLDKQKQDLTNQETALSDYTVVAPFAGTASAVNVQVGDAGGSAAVATIITNQQVATLSLNEVDAAKLTLGDKATLTFDAIDSLTLTGTIAQLDNVGTVAQGVVSYTVKITFDSQDARVKPGMTVNASIITDAHQDVLVVPSSAVKTTGGASYVLAFDPPLADASSTQGVVSMIAPQQVPVTTGLSDDTNVEILSGLTEGQQIVVRTTTGAATAAVARTTTTAGAAGATRAGGGGFGGGGAAIRL